MSTLDLNVLRTLIAAVETGSFAGAAKRVGRSESAVSLQVQRLEEMVGQPLFRRSGRRMVLTEPGTTLLDHAYRMLELNDEALRAVSGATLHGAVRLGVPQDFAETWLPIVIARFARSHPAASITTVVDRSPALLARLDRGELDLVVVFSGEERSDAIWSAQVPMVWIGPGGYRRRASEPVHLVAFDPPCVFRAAATSALEQRGIGCVVAFISPSLAGLWSAIDAGLGISVRTPASIPSHLAVLRPSAELPELPQVKLSLHANTRSAETKTVQQLQVMLTESLSRSLDSGI